jgi:hypothetical protein
LLSLYPAQRGVARAANLGAPLHLAVAELHDAGRHVAQIAQAYAACSCEQFLALEDEALAALVGTAARAADGDGELSTAAAGRIAAAAQQAAQRTAARARREVMSREQSLEELLAFSGHPE